MAIMGFPKPELAKPVNISNEEYTAAIEALSEKNIGYKLKKGTCYHIGKNNYQYQHSFLKAHQGIIVIGSKLNSGSFGKVKLSYYLPLNDHKVQSLIALKMQSVLTTSSYYHLTSRNWDIYKNEGFIAKDQGLADDCIIRHHAGRFNNLSKYYIPYYYMGQTLSDYLIQYRDILSRKQQFDLAIKLFILLGRLHSGESSNLSNQTFHGDIKPGNIVIDVVLSNSVNLDEGDHQEVADVELKLIDFGFSVTKDENCCVGTNCGTKLYLPNNCKKETKERLDLYAALRTLGLTRTFVLWPGAKLVNRFCLDDKDLGIFSCQLIDGESDLNRLLSSASSDCLTLPQSFHADDIAALLILMRNHLYTIKNTKNLKLLKPYLLAQYEIDSESINQNIINGLADQFTTLKTESAIDYRKINKPKNSKHNDNKALILYIKENIQYGLLRAFILTFDQNKKEIIVHLFEKLKQINELEPLRGLLKCALRALSHHCTFYKGRMFNFFDSTDAYSAAEMYFDRARIKLNIDDDQWEKIQYCKKEDLSCSTMTYQVQHQAALLFLQEQNKQDKVDINDLLSEVS